ncbi:hypothetical protein CI109_100874 [Kwoniella shandongensis]|uniref:Uncharacterized protein n=1 Tax=Kwoniella shandongensis TaxID=1734106 RepID=A0A5M6BRN1_9TREE|nr:uncharacterized protein CI109_006127 [Kwoniella shandongensis]KAA5525554.1 hypothetical protein CI109_006127 [Kwoniella shandongensis]
MSGRSSSLSEYNLSRYLVGVSLLLGVVVLWTASNFITASLETGEDSWNKPFLITYFNTASFTIYLLPTLWRRYRSTSPSHPHSHSHSHPQQPYLSLPTSEPPTSHRYSSDQPTRRSTSQTRSISIPPSSPRIPLHTTHTDLPPLISDGEGNSSPSSEVYTVLLPRLTIRETAEIAAWWSLVWFIANWTVNASLAWTSVASVTILSSTSGFFTLALGRICGVESLTRTKVFAVVASFIGVLLVTHSDSSLAPSSTEPNPLGTAEFPTHPIFGDILALLSAAFYAVYVILLKVRVVDEERADMQLMLGFAGLFNTIFLIPIFPILHYTGWETFELPPTKEAWIICLINFCITLSSDYLYVLAMLKTTPMLVTIGLSLTIPLALVGSLFIPSSSEAITLLSILGATLVFVGFAMLGWQGYEESKSLGEVVVVDPLEDGDEDEERGRRRGEF